MSSNNGATTIYSDVIINAEYNKESGLSVYKDQIGENKWMSLGRFSYTGDESNDACPFISVGEGTTSYNKNKCFMMVYSKSASDGTVFGSFGFSNNDHIIKVNTDRSVRIDGNLNVSGTVNQNSSQTITHLTTLTGTTYNTNPYESLSNCELEELNKQRAEQDLEPVTNIIHNYANIDLGVWCESDGQISDVYKTISDPKIVYVVSVKQNL